MLKLILSRQEMARPFAAPPGVPDDRKAALRKAFDDAWADPELLAEMKARGQEVNPVSGAALDELIAELYTTPKDVVEETRKRDRGANDGAARPDTGLSTMLLVIPDQRLVVFTYTH